MKEALVRFVYWLAITLAAIGKGVTFDEAALLMSIRKKDD